MQNGLKIPSIGYGTFLTADNDTLADSVHLAIKSGVRHIDAAWVYNNEISIGKGIKRAIDEKIVTREELFVTEKLFPQHMTKAGVRPATEELLEKLQLDYVDMLMIHHGLPVDTKTGKLIRVPQQEGWTAMEECVDAGLARSLGVSNFTVQKLWDIMCYAKYQPQINQVECHPYYNQAIFKKFCDEYDVLITAFAPLSAPHRLANKSLPDAKIALEEPVILNIAKNHNKSAAQII